MTVSDDGGERGLSDHLHRLSLVFAGIRALSKKNNSYLGLEPQHRTRAWLATQILD